MRLDLPAENMLVSIIVADRRQDRGICCQRDRWQCAPFSKKTPNKFCGEMLGIGCAAPVSAPENFPAVQNCAAHFRRNPFKGHELELQVLNDLQMFCDSLFKDFRRILHSGSLLWIGRLPTRSYKHNTGTSMIGLPGPAPFPGIEFVVLDRDRVINRTALEVRTSAMPRLSLVSRRGLPDLLRKHGCKRSAEKEPRESYSSDTVDTDWNVMGYLPFRSLQKSLSARHATRSLAGSPLIA